MNGTVFTPGVGDDEGFVELARTKQGRLFRKQILHMNDSFVHPNDPTTKINVDQALAASLAANFDAKICDIVQVPVVDEQNSHSEDPLRNIGEVVGVEHDDKGVYAIIDARKPVLADELDKTLIGASAMMHLNYTDTKSGKQVGPTLLHVAVTNRPYVTDLDDFQEVIGLSADTDINDPPAVLLDAATTQEEVMPQTKEELIAALKADHGLDVAALEAQVSAAPQAEELATALSNVLKEAGVVSLSNKPEDETITIKDIAEAVVELSNDKVGLEKQVGSLVKQHEEITLSTATKEVEAFIKEGRILPKQKEAMIALSVEDRETFELLLPDEPLVSMSAEGVTAHEEPISEVYTQETERLLELANKIQTGTKK